MNKADFGHLVFRTTQLNPMKVNIGDDSITFSMPVRTLVCDIVRGGVKTTVASDARTELMVEFNENVFITLRREQNQVVALIKAHKSIKILRDNLIDKTAG